MVAHAAQEEVHRIRVADEVVDLEEQPGLAARQPRHDDLEEPSVAREIEGLARDALAELLQRSSRIALSAEIDRLDVGAQGRIERLARRAALRRDARAEGVGASHVVFDGGGEHLERDRLVDQRRAGDDVEARGGEQMLVHPDEPLGFGQRT